MFSALSKLLLLLLLLPAALRAQADACFGETFAHILSDDRGRDLRMTCALSYPGPSGDILLGGGVNGNILLSRIDRRGNLRWRRVIRARSESTELSTLNELVIDPFGNIAGVGTTYNDDVQRAYLFRYDPNADSLLYFLQPEFSSELTGIKVLDNAEYLISGSRLGEPFPNFISAYTQHVSIPDGRPSRPGTRYDYRGDESFLDATLAADGTLYAVGNVSATGGAGDIRASVSRIGPDGLPVWSVLGPVRGEVNARLYAHDVELIGDRLYVLHWGNIGNITGGINTTVYLSCLDAATGSIRWNYDYDLTDFDGENGLELEPHRGGLLVYGLKLIGKRDPWLMQLSTDGEVEWARAFELPGNALVYVRANQQLHVDDAGITALASYGFADGSARRGLVLRLAPDGRSESACLNELDLAVERTPLVNDWQRISLEVNELSAAWQDAATGTEPDEFTARNDCAESCEDCSAREFRRAFVCRGDSVLLAGAYRTDAGIFPDTFPAATAGCDSILFTELIVSDGPTATYAVRRECGLSEARVTVSAQGLAQPLSYAWPGAQTDGNIAFLAAGDYVVTVNDAIGCRPLELAVTVEPSAQPSTSLRVAPPACPGDSSGVVRLIPRGAGALRLLPGEAFFPDEISGLPAGQYQLILRDSTGCEVFRQVSVPEAEPLSVSIAGPRRVLLGEEAYFAAEYNTGQSVIAETWSTADTVLASGASVVLRPRATLPLRLTTTTERGCVAADSLSLEVIRGSTGVYLPTAFSPNGDGINDVFAPGLGPDVERVLSCAVYDRWGNQRWAYAGTRWWDGKGAPAAVYAYTITLRLIDGTEVTRAGQITLLR